MRLMPVSFGNKEHKQEQEYRGNPEEPNFLALDISSTETKNQYRKTKQRPLASQDKISK